MDIAGIIFSLLGGKGMAILIAVGAAILGIFGIKANAKRKGVAEEKDRQRKQQIKEAEQIDEFIDEVNRKSRKRPTASELRNNARAKKR